MKKLKTVLLLSVTAFSFLAMAEGDTPAPQRPDLAYSHGHTGGSPEYTHGEGWSPSYAHGNTGIVNNEAEGDTSAPQA
ncbi:hypothetical protein BGI23_24925 [Bacillus sp. ABP14]|uniref:hypothetical protein n=1 Tax=Bacillus sp. ABP14 TaxID=1892404 RepID=UPI0008A81758|nr:hypothetical protein [Bacillus sp. ABP14]AOY18404.1 hypothetical protein BGI23_24925 [Bacillus sp. ABP14]